MGSVGFVRTFVAPGEGAKRFRGVRANMEVPAPWGLVDARPILATFGPGDACVAAIASKQHGLVSVAQLRFAGLSGSAVHHRFQRGRLHRVHRGVYAVGHRGVGDRSVLAGAVLAVGSGAAASHRRAAVEFRILAPGPGPVDVSLPATGEHRRSRAGIRVHQFTQLGRRDLIGRDGIPLTSPATTLIAIAETDRHELEDALNEARALRLVNPRDLGDAIRRHGGRCGAARLAAVLAAENDSGFSRSRAEQILTGLIGRSGLPAPHRNRSVHGVELDFYWPEGRVNVETDGFAAHGRRRNFESDRDRDAHLASRGIQVLRFTWWQLTREQPKVVARIASALALRGGA